MITTVIIAIVCFAVGGGLSYMLFRYGLKSKYDIIINCLLYTSDAADE